MFRDNPDEVYSFPQWSEIKPNHIIPNDISMVTLSNFFTGERIERGYKLAPEISSFPANITCTWFEESE